MSLDKAIASGKEKRKMYRKSKRFDKSCRNHGTCPWCISDRMHSSRKSDPLLAGTRDNEEENNVVECDDVVADT